MKKNLVFLFIASLMIFTACKKNTIQANEKQPKVSTINGQPASTIYATGYRFGWTVFNLSNYCEFCPFWLCKGSWKPTPQPQKTELMSYAYIEDKHLVFEVLVEDYKIGEVENYIENDTIEFTPPSDEIRYMNIPEEIVSGLKLSYDRIYPGKYLAKRIKGTDKIKIIF